MEDGFKELMRSLDNFFMKDKDSEKLMKATVLYCGKNIGQESD